MAKVTITITDNETDGPELDVQFDPLIPKHRTSALTEAQSIGIALIRNINDIMTALSREALQAEIDREYFNDNGPGGGLDNYGSLS